MQIENKMQKLIEEREDKDIAAFEKGRILHRIKDVISENYNLSSMSQGANHSVESLGAAKDDEPKIFKSMAPQTH